jgi:hypothetical protein
MHVRVVRREIRGIEMWQCWRASPTSDLRGVSGMNDTHLQKIRAARVDSSTIPACRNQRAPVAG